MRIQFISFEWSNSIFIAALLYLSDILNETFIFLTNT